MLADGASQTDQFTPPGATSLATVALTTACVAAVMVAGGVCTNASDGVCATMVVATRSGSEGVDAGAEEEAVRIT